MYVPGKVASPKTVIINIGTGYYVEKASTVHFFIMVKKKKNPSTQNILPTYQ
jgi:prefoldin subunit 5